MTAIDFPNSPTTNQTFTSGSTTWKYDGSKWKVVTSPSNLSSATPDALTPDQTGAAGTSSDAARADHAHEILTATASTITGTNAEGTSTSFARADHDHAFGSKSVPASALALGPTYETSLPGSPVDGQEIYYAADTTNGVIWHLRYRSAGGTYKWEFIGGSALTSYIDTNQTTSSSTYGDLATAGPSITVPVNGEYEITYQATIYNDSSASSTGARIKLNINGSTLADTRPFIEHLSAVAFLLHSPVKTQIESVTGTRVVKMVYNNRTGSGNANFSQRFLSIRPVRIG